MASPSPTAANRLAPRATCPTSPPTPPPAARPRATRPRPRPRRPRPPTSRRWPRRPAGSHPGQHRRGPKADAAMATSAGATRPADLITFAHNSERQFARLLDFYRVEWEYEPTAFPIEWDAAGQPTQHFRPDCYLPGFCLYIEITTLNQRLVTKKNRKVRRLRELYPDVRIKVLYQRDYLSLLAKYGLEPPSQMAATTTAGERGPVVPEGSGRTPRAWQGIGAVKGPLRGTVSGAVERATAAGRPRVVPDPPGPVPPLPADPELVRLAQVPLPAEVAQRRGPAAAERAG